MNNRQLKKRLRSSLQGMIRQEQDFGRKDETIRLCGEIMRGQTAVPAGPRLGFWQFLAGVFRFTWAPIVLFQTGALLLAGLFLAGAPKELRYIPVYVPLFVLAVIPVLFQGQYFGTGELEAATRSSGAQIVLAKLVLSGAANLVCMTVLVLLEVRLLGGRSDLGRIILYCLVPYLVCATVLLQLIRRREKNGMPRAVAMSLGSCLFWRLSSRVAPGLYEVSAAGIWAAGFAVFLVFFAREIYFIVKADKEGKMYGTVL